MRPSTEPLSSFWDRPRLNADLEWEVGEPPPNPLPKDHPDYGSAFSENHPKTIAHDFGWAHIAAEGAMTMHLSEGVWWELLPLHLHDGLSPCRVAQLWPSGIIPFEVLADRGWVGDLVFYRQWRTLTDAQKVRYGRPREWRRKHG